MSGCFIYRAGSNFIPSCFLWLNWPLLVWWALTPLQRRVVKVEKAEKALRHAPDDLSEANQRLEFLIRVSRHLAKADDEETLMDIILDLPQEIVPAVGCSFTRFDEQGYPRLAMNRGDLDLDMSGYQSRKKLLCTLKTE